MKRPFMPEFNLNVATAHASQYAPLWALYYVDVSALPDRHNLFTPGARYRLTLAFGPPPTCDRPQAAARARESSSDSVRSDAADMPIIRPRDIVISPVGDSSAAPLIPVATEGGPYSWTGSLLVITVAWRGPGAMDPRGVNTRYRLSIRPVKGLDPTHASAVFALALDHIRPPAQAVPLRASADAELQAGDYQTRDYLAIRTLLLAHLSQKDPSWQNRSPADVGVTIVEVLAYAGDYLSYHQDAVATEAYLTSARLRTSVARHARLLDYPVDQGMNSRVWVVLQVNRPARLPAGLQLLAAGGLDDVVVAQDSEQYRQALAANALVFATMTAVDVDPNRNRLSIYTADMLDFTLDAGATSATLRVPGGAGVSIAAGDVLVFEQVASPDQRSADPRRRHAVRVQRVHHDRIAPAQSLVTVQWYADDALPFSLPVTATQHGVTTTDMTVVWSNVVLADLGQPVCDPETPPLPATSMPYRLHLKRSPVVSMAPFDAQLARAQSARATLDTSAQDSLPAVVLTQRIDPWWGVARPRSTVAPDDTSPDTHVWRPVADLLASSPMAREFVAETEAGGAVTVRFGNGQLGREPSPGSRFRAYYRIGNSSAGNVGADTITAVVADGQEAVRCLRGIVASVRNPLPAQGGRAPEPLSSIKRNAPVAFQTRQSCVTLQDYVDIAESIAGVGQAAAAMKWTGSWPTAMVYVRSASGAPIEQAVIRAVERRLAQARVAGRAIAVFAPVYISVYAAVAITLAAGFLPESVEESLLSAFSAGTTDTGSLGIFNPALWGFGQVLHSSAIVERARAVAGVAQAEITSLERIEDPPDSERRPALAIAPAFNEIIQVQNDPAVWQNGRIVFRIASESGS